ncbi:hypothetical protein K443DRAFT_134497 [Laccaria amethystina LaAM-08-1]|uniref:Uncharacterized protein n=1 Tax=Laccaria amethystina LaAM-08-1 TaxID=1095629 RepID=A0A0C9X1N5_9AGAR|nr:hypothetical protein K443DRAFT_134497 [Laccaria amethystina LaAM-08-1]
MNMTVYDMGNIIGDDVPDSEDEQSVQGGANNLPPRSLKKTKKAAYNVYFSRTTVRCSAASQVKFFPGSVYEGFSTILAAIAAWEYAVSNKTIGSPNTPRRQVNHNTTVNTTTVVLPSMPSRQVMRITPSTPIPVATNSTAPISLTASASSSDFSSDSQSSHGSEACLAGIVAAMDNMDIAAYYADIRGKAPGVYSTSTSALAALGTNPRGLCCFVPKKTDADAMFVAWSMTGEIECLQ